VIRKFETVRKTLKNKQISGGCADAKSYIVQVCDATVDAIKNKSSAQKNLRYKSKRI